MNKKQWSALSISFILIGFLFIYLDTSWNNLCQGISLYDGETPATPMDITACVKAEVLSPFIYIFFFFGIIIIPILSFLENKKK